MSGLTLFIWATRPLFLALLVCLSVRVVMTHAVPDADRVGYWQNVREETRRPARQNYQCLAQVARLCAMYGSPVVDLLFPRGPCIYHFPIGFLWI